MLVRSFLFYVTIYFMSTAKFRKVSKGYQKPKKVNNGPKKEEGDSLPKKD